jgi:hypothetical protein
MWSYTFLHLSGSGEGRDSISRSFCSATSFALFRASISALEGIVSAMYLMNLFISVLLVSG